jgi:hypothetical protein
MSQRIRFPATWLARLARRFWSGDAWQYPGGKRDLRLDFLRGFAVVVMVVDHIGGEHSWLYAVTGGDRFLVSVAEAFIFLSGLVMGMIYAGIMVRQGLGAALMKCLHRAGSLYLLTVSLTLAYAVVLFRLGHWVVPEGAAVDWPDFVMSAVTLHRTVYLTDIMLLYTLLILAAVPVFVLLLHGYTAFVLAGSWGLWLLWQLSPQHAQFPWQVTHNYFHFSAWQVVFMTALVIGYHRQYLEVRLARLSLPVVLGVTGTLVVGAIAFYVAQPLAGTDYTWLVDRLFGKADLRIGRLVLFAGFFGFAYALLTVAWDPLSRTCAWLLLPLGQKALTAYNVHLFVVAILTRLPSSMVGEAPPTTLQNTFLQALGVLMIWTMLRLQPAVVAYGSCWIERLKDLSTLRQKDFYAPGYAAHKKSLPL